MKRQIIEGISSLYYMLARRAAGTNCCLMYHAVHDSKTKKGYLDSWSVDFENFKRQISWLQDNEDFFWCKFGHDEFRDGKNGISITFDDGYKDNFELAYPFLKENNIPFTIFVIADFIRDENNSDYMNISDLKEILSYEGATIGIHGASHTAFTELTQEELESELDRSIALMNEIGITENYMLSYPHGRFNAGVEATVKAKGISTVGTSLVGGINSGTDQVKIPRIPILFNDGTESFQKKVLGAFDWYRFLQGR